MDSSQGKQRGGLKMAEKRGRIDPLDSAVRERLLEVAAKLFARKGYAATTTREIVAAARVTKPVLYYYFQNKEGIYLELMQRAFKRFDDVVIASSTESGNIEQRLLHLCDQIFGLIVEKIEVLRLIYSIYYGPPQGAPFLDVDAVHQRLFESVRQLVIEGIRKRELRKGDTEDITWAILGALHVTMENELSHPERELGHRGLRRILNLIFQGISVRQGRKRGGEKK
jgi:TetR/AcrR family transcriptional regulator